MARIIPTEYWLRWRNSIPTKKDSFLVQMHITSSSIGSRAVSFTLHSEKNHTIASCAVAVAMVTVNRYKRFLLSVSTSGLIGISPPIWTTSSFAPTLANRRKVASQGNAILTHQPVQIWIPHLHEDGPATGEGGNLLFKRHIFWSSGDCFPVYKLFTWIKSLLFPNPTLGTPIGIRLVATNFCWQDHDEKLGWSTPLCSWWKLL